MPLPRVHLALAGLACTAQVGLATPQGLRITEYTYNSSSGEFIELTNLGAAPLSLAGWSIDDIEAIPGAFDLSAGGILAAGASIVVTTEPAAAFSAAWGLVGVTVLGDNTTAKLSRTDAIHVFDPFGAVADRLEFGDEVFEYTVRTLDVSAYVCPSAVGLDDPYGWRLSLLGDSQGSTTSATGDVGSPGRHTAAPCVPLPLGEVYCNSAPNSSGAIAQPYGYGHPIAPRNDFQLAVSHVPALTVGYAVASRTSSFITNPGGSSGHLCLGGAVARLIGTLRPASGAGEWSAPIDLPNVPFGPVLAGESWCFQLWFRDADPTPTSNFSDGLRVHFH